MKLMRIVFTLLACLFLAMPSFAVNPDEMLDDPALEARAREISEGLRCLVCQNESIDDSNADLARDLRILVRNRLSEGDTDQQVVDYIVARYGEFVLLRPVMAPHTLLLWLAAPILLIIGAVGVFFFLRRQKPTATAPDHLTPEEEDALARLKSNGQ